MKQSTRKQSSNHKAASGESHTEESKHSNGSHKQGSYQAQMETSGLYPTDWTVPKTPPFNPVYSPSITLIVSPCIYGPILRILGKV